MAFDPDAFLAQEEKKETDSEPAKAFDVDAFLAQEAPEPESTTPTAPTGPVAPSEGALLGAVAPAVTGYGMGATGAGQLGRDAFSVARPLAQSLIQGGRDVANIYKASPIMAPLADAIGMATIGIPPVAASQSAMGAYDKYKALEASKNVGSQVLSQGAPSTTPVRGAPTTTTIEPYIQMSKSATPEVSQKLTELYGAKTGGGGNNAVRSWLNSAEGRAAQAANPEFAAKAAEYLKAVPGYGSQAMKIVSPILKGAARVAGPAGMAYNLYEAAPYLEQAGPELTSGRAKNRMVEAQQMMLNRPTPAPLSPQEASNLLQSDDQRTINIYGGRAHLEALVKSGVRQRAASRILSPIAPGQ